MVNKFLHFHGYDDLVLIHFAGCGATTAETEFE